MTSQQPIPFLDLITPHQELKTELCEILDKALQTAGFIGGPMVQDFEQAFAQFCETDHCAGVGSGTDALRFALVAAGIGSGDAVITTPNTFIATAEAITQAGARPVFVDIDEATYNMDPNRLQEYLEAGCRLDERTGKLVDSRNGCRVAAVVPVHLYGQPANMDPILDLASQYGLTVIEDACQAHGAQYYSATAGEWRRAGSIGRAAAFSFYPGKNLGACGEAGAVVTNDADLANKIRMIRDHGQIRKYYHEVEGYNGRLDAIQAGFLGAKLKHLARWNEMRRAAAVRYRELFAGSEDGVVLPTEPDWARSVYHLFVVRVSGRDDLMKSLGAAGIGTAIHYPIPLHLQKALTHLGYARGEFPVAERVADQIVSLPMSPTLTIEQQRRVVAEIGKALSPAPALPAV
jgi:dTDP-4-amino-4,6-dideoxygalactose transaminase